MICRSWRLESYLQNNENADVFLKCGLGTRGKGSVASYAKATPPFKAFRLICMRIWWIFSL